MGTNQRFSCFGKWLIVGVHSTWIRQPTYYFKCMPLMWNYWRKFLPFMSLKGIFLIRWNKESSRCLPLVGIKWTITQWITFCKGKQNAQLIYIYINLCLILNYEGTDCKCAREAVSMLNNALCICKASIWNTSVIHSITYSWSCVWAKPVTSQCELDIFI